MHREVLIFGAGNIGRSFITPVFLDAGYTVYLTDINEQLILSLKKTGSYQIRICDKNKESTRRVEGFHPLYLNDMESLRPVLKRVPVMVTSVGQVGLEAVAGLLGKTLHERLDQNGRFLPLDIILAENMRDASGVCREKILENLEGNFPVESLLGLIESSIGKMVPVLSEEEVRNDPLGLKAESYNTLILDKDGFVGPLPKSPSIKLVSPIQAWVDRKIFIHNMGHAAAAFLGRQYFPGETFLAPLMEKEWFISQIRDIMLEGANILIREYPDIFYLSELVHHIYDLLSRFANPSLGDTVERVGRDLSRKLSRNDRIVGAMREAVKHNLPFKGLGQAYLAALLFEQENTESGKFNITKLFRDKGLEETYLKVSCGGEAPDDKDRTILSVLKRIQMDPPRQVVKCTCVRVGQFL